MGWNHHESRNIFISSEDFKFQPTYRWNSAVSSYEIHSYNIIILQLSEKSFKFPDIHWSVDLRNMSFHEFIIFFFETRYN